MADASDLTLARLSQAAYSDGPVGLPKGFAPVDAAALAVDPTTGTYAEGVFRNGNGAALVTTGVVDGVATLVVAFRGSDDREDSLNDLQDINAAYPDFAGLVAAVDAYAAEAGVAQVAVTGHSLGGSMAQLYMANHPAEPGSPAYFASTFGSPGALQAAGADGRIENFVVADDPAVFLGTHRAGAGEALRADPVLTAAAADRAAEVFPGLTAADAAASVPFLTADYVNRGSFEVLPAASRAISPEAALTGLAEADPARHDIGLYVAEVAEAVAMPGSTVTVPDEGGNAADIVYRALYSGEVQDAADLEALIPGVLRDWLAGQGQDALPGFLGQKWDAFRAAAATTTRSIDDLF